MIVVYLFYCWRHAFVSSQVLASYGLNVTDTYQLPVFHVVVVFDLMLLVLRGDTVFGVWLRAGPAKQSPLCLPHANLKAQVKCVLHSGNADC